MALYLIANKKLRLSLVRDSSFKLHLAMVASCVKFFDYCDFR